MSRLSMILLDNHLGNGLRLFSKWSRRGGTGDTSPCNKQSFWAVIFDRILLANWRRSYSTKPVIMVLLALLITANSYAKSGEIKYLREIVSKADILNIANSPLFRIDFSLGRTSIPTVHAYFQQQGIDIETAEPEIKQETLDAWVNEYYPKMTEEQLLEELDANSHLRAFVVTFALVAQALQLQGQQPSIQHLFRFAIGHSMLWEAIDKDVPIQDLMLQRDQAKSMFSIGFSDNEQSEFYVPHDRVYNYADIGAYILRANHVRKLPLSDGMREILLARGYSQSQVDTMNLEAADALISQKVVPDADSDTVLGLDMALLVDLLSEPMIVNNSIPSIYQLADSAYPVTTYIAAEMSAEWENIEARVIALLNAKDEPASMFQIAQLVRLGFSLDEIERMTYATRDAIIVANPVSRHGFVDAEGEDISAWNALIAEKGSLTFLLRRYHHSLDAINPHHPISVDRHVELLSRAEQYNQR
ncbi:MAG: hypothetical protein OYH77_03055 [Pseudomonadota bacterium]|nr:hypothetical protein [Pseudomonadota bacterium]